MKKTTKDCCGTVVKSTIISFAWFSVRIISSLSKLFFKLKNNRMVQNEKYGRMAAIWDYCNVNTISKSLKMNYICFI